MSKAKVKLLKLQQFPDCYYQRHYGLGKAFRGTP